MSRSRRYIRQNGRDLWSRRPRSQHPYCKEERKICIAMERAAELLLLHYEVNEWHLDYGEEFNTDTTEEEN